MGDRCYSSGYCRERDVPLFEEEGWTLDEIEGENGAHIVDQECNFAGYDALRKLAENGIPFIMSHGEGGSYEPGLNVSDGTVFVDIASTEGMPVCSVNPDGTLNGYETAKLYWEVHARATEMLAAAEVKETEAT